MEMFQRALNQQQKMMIAIGLAILFVCGSVIAYIMINKESKEETTMIPLTSNESNLESINENIEQREEPSTNQQVPEIRMIVVDVKGQVIRPGVYSLEEGMRVNDAISAAGGLTSEADSDVINLATRLIDGMAIIVPKLGEEARTPIVQGGSETTATIGTGQGKVNLNTASVTELETLPGIGPSKSSAIIQYREENKGFKTIEDLMEVSGIGEKTFEKLRELITVQ